MPNHVLEGNTATKNAVSVEAEHGVKSDKKAVKFQGETYHSSGDPVKDLCHAIGACAPDAAAQIMAAALEDLSHGGLFLRSFGPMTMLLSGLQMPPLKIWLLLRRDSSRGWQTGMGHCCAQTIVCAVMGWVFPR